MSFEKCKGCAFEKTCDRISFPPDAIEKCQLRNLKEVKKNEPDDVCELPGLFDHFNKGV
jgi:hypothetical protein